MLVSGPRTSRGLQLAWRVAGVASAGVVLLVGDVVSPLGLRPLLALTMGDPVGVGPEILLQLSELEQAGVQRVMLQWMDLDDLQGLEALRKAVG